MSGMFSGAFLIEKRLIDATVTFLTESDGGRETPPSLNGFVYRPGVVKEESAADVSFGIAFRSGPDNFALGDEVNAVFTVLAWPDPTCDWMKTGAKFRISEGGKVVGFGCIDRAWSEESE